MKTQNIHKYKNPQIKRRGLEWPLLLISHNYYEPPSKPLHSTKPKRKFQSANKILISFLAGALFGISLHLTLNKPHFFKSSFLMEARKVDKRGKKKIELMKSKKIKPFITQKNLEKK